MIKILFVCHGNICRSPMAEYVLRDMAQKQAITLPGGIRLPELHIASAATSTEEIGNPVHRGTRDILRRHGIDTSGKRARQMTWRDYEEYDYLIGMDKANVLNMARIAVGDPEEKIYLLLHFAGEETNIADPWYTGDFETTYRDVVRGCEGFLKFLARK